MPQISEIRTATVSTGLLARLISLTFHLNSVGALARKTKSYDDAVIINTGTVPLYFAVVRDLQEVPTDADRKTLAVGQEKAFDELNTDLIYISTSDEGQSSVLEFEGKPVYRP